MNRSTSLTPLKHTEKWTQTHALKETCGISPDEVIVAHDKEKKSEKGGRDYVYLFATNFPYDSETILELYKDRWAIETSYRMYNQFLMKTTSRNYTIMLFYFLFACLMYNAWVLYNNESYDEKEDVMIKVIQLKTFLIEVIMQMSEVT